MTSNGNHLRIGHLNVRGIERHIDEVKLILDKKQYHFFGISETKLKASAPVGPIKIPGYNFIRHSLPCGRGRGAKTCGGVGLYIAKHIKATPIIKSTFDPATAITQRVEYLAVRAKINNYNVGVVVLYNPSSNNQLLLQKYEQLLLDLLDFNFDRIYIVGDYNINVSSAHATGNQTGLKRLHDTFNLTVLRTPPTRITETSSTTIDLLVTDSPGTIIKASTSSANSCFDHEVVFLSVFLIADLRVRKPTPQRQTFRNFRRVDQLRLQADFEARDKLPILECTNIDRKTALLTTELQLLLDQHAPEETFVYATSVPPGLQEISNKQFTSRTWLSNFIRETPTEPAAILSGEITAQNAIECGP